MKTKLNWKLLKMLLNEIGIPSFEKSVQEIIIDTMNSELYTHHYTALNNLVLTSKSKKKKRIVVCSHSDEVGFLIKKINTMGQAEVIPLGSMLVHTTYGARFAFKSIKGKELIGVLIQPSIHEMEIRNFPRRRPVRGRERIWGILYNAFFDKKSHYIDFGFNSKKDAERAGIRVGCQGTFATKAIKISKGKILSKALDNRLGTYLNLVTSLTINESENYAIDRVFGVREEIGAVAVTTALNSNKYDAAIVLDISPAREKDKLGILGKGPLKRIHDATHITNAEIIKNIENTAKKYNINIQPYISLGGTDAGMINVHKNGIPIIPLNIAARYIHTGNSICDIKDILEANKMLIALLKEIGPKWFTL